MTFGQLRPFICLAIIGYCASPASAGILFSDDFNTAGSSTNWTVNATPAANAAQQDAVFGYDYSAMGIPAAPGNAPTDTFGMRLRANIPGSAAVPVTTRPTQALSGLSVSPTGGNYGANFGMTFYAWSNFNGAASNNTGLADNGNSEGGTNNLLFAIGTSGTVPLAVGNTTLSTGASMDAIGFATTGDGGITNDYRVYPKSGTIAATSSLAAGSYSNTAALYSSLFGTHTAPAIQQTLSTAEYGLDANNTQQGSTQTGAFGFAWHKVEIIKYNGIVTWDVDGTRLATFDASALSLGGNNIALGQSDVNTGTTRHPSLVFTVYDNLVINDVPEPASCTLAALCLATIGFVSSRRGA